MSRVSSWWEAVVYIVHKVLLYLITSYFCHILIWKNTYHISYMHILMIDYMKK